MGVLNPKFILVALGFGGLGGGFALVVVVDEDSDRPKSWRPIPSEVRFFGLLTALLRLFSASVVGDEFGLIRW
jgi:hypothetical protein